MTKKNQKNQQKTASEDPCMNNAFPWTAFIWIYATLVLHDLKTFLEACIYKKKKPLSLKKKV